MRFVRDAIYTVIDTGTKNRLKIVKRFLLAIRHLFAVRKDSRVLGDKAVRFHPELNRFGYGDINVRPTARRHILDRRIFQRRTVARRDHLAASENQPSAFGAFYVVDAPNFASVFRYADIVGNPLALIPHL